MAWLPVEIWEKIIDDLPSCSTDSTTEPYYSPPPDTATFAACSATCRVLYSLTHYRLFSTICIWSSERGEELLELVSTNPHIPTWVHSVRVETTRPGHDDPVSERSFLRWLGWSASAMLMRELSQARSLSVQGLGLPKARGAPGVTWALPTVDDLMLAKAWDALLHLRSIGALTISSCLFRPTSLGMTIMSHAYPQLQSLSLDNVHTTGLEPSPKWVESNRKDAGTLVQIRKLRLLPNLHTHDVLTGMMEYMDLSLVTSLHLTSAPLVAGVFALHQKILNNAPRLERLTLMRCWGLERDHPGAFHLRSNRHVKHVVFEEVYNSIDSTWYSGFLSTHPDVVQLQVVELHGRLDTLRKYGWESLDRFLSRSHFQQSQLDRQLVLEQIDELGAFVGSPDHLLPMTHAAGTFRVRFPSLYGQGTQETRCLDNICIHHSLCHTCFQLSGQEPTQTRGLREGKQCLFRALLAGEGTSGSGLDSESDSD